jgi:hypothetical protein
MAPDRFKDFEMSMGRSLSARHGRRQLHPVDLPGNENMQPWFLGINPRGLVPLLVHDGAVHIEIRLQTACAIRGARQG